MRDSSWVVKGVDADTRRAAAAEARRRGLSLADYLTEAVLQAAMGEQLRAPSPAEVPPEDTAASLQARVARQDGLATRHRLEELERRVTWAVDGFETAVRGVDSSVSSLTSRLDGVEQLAADAAEQLSRATQEAAANFAALRKRLSEAEHQADAVAGSQEEFGERVAARCAALAERVEAAENSARAANTAAAQLSAAQETLKQAVAEDFTAFARDTAARLSADLDDVRAAADAAAEQAEAAASHLVGELRKLRESVDSRLRESAAETRARMQTAFVESAARITALVDRVAENERAAQREGERLRAQLADIEDGAHTAIEETAEALRQADAALAGELTRTAQNHRAALESAQAGLSADIAELRESSAERAERLRQLDSALGGVANDVAELRQAMEARLTQSRSDWTAKLDALAARLASHERGAGEAQFTLRAEIERVESCTFAALEKLARDRSTGEEALRQAHAQLGAQIAELRDQATGKLARLETALGPLGERLAQIEAGAASGLAQRVSHLENELADRAVDERVDERLRRLELLSQDDETAHAIAALRGQLGALAAQLDAHRLDSGALQQIDELRARIFSYEAQAGEAVDQAHSVARVLSRLTAQNAESARRVDERLGEMEAALSALRAGQSAEDAAAAVRLVEQRVVELEHRQAAALQTLRADMARFVAENERRLNALEQDDDGGDVAAAFEALRERIEERVVGVEQRSVRALEQVADTMAVLEQRFLGGADAQTQSA